MNVNEEVQVNFNQEEQVNVNEKEHVNANEREEKVELVENVQEEKMDNE